MPFAGSNTDAAWLAGIIDGEGSINSYLRKKRKSGCYGVFLQIVNTDERIIKKICNLCNLQTKTYCSIREKRKPIYHVTTAKSEEITSILNATIPYLTGIKRLRAVLALEYLELRGNWGEGKGHRITNEEISIIKEIQEVH